MVSWMVRMLSLVYYSFCQLFYPPPRGPLWHINQVKALVTLEDYHVVIYNIILVNRNDRQVDERA